MTLDYLRKGALYISLSLAGIAGPAVLYSPPSSVSVYAQEKKTLEMRLSEEIKELEKKEDKSASEYVRLVDLFFNFKKDKDKILSIVAEAKKSIAEEMPEYQYLQATLLWLNNEQDKAIQIGDAIIQNKRANSRLKSNSVLRFHKPNLEKASYRLLRSHFQNAIELDDSNLAAYLGLFKDVYEREIKNFPDPILEKSFETSSIKDRIKKNRDLENLVSEAVKTYDKAARLHDKIPEKLIYLLEIHKSFADTLTLAILKVRGTDGIRFPSLQAEGSDLISLEKKLYKECFNTGTKCCNALLKIEESYENYMLKGQINFFGHRAFDDKSRAQLRCYDKAYKAFDKAYDLAKKMRFAIKSSSSESKDIQDKNKKIGDALYYKGSALLGKAKSLDDSKWSYNNLNYSQKRLAKKAITAFEGSLKFYPSEYLNRETIELLIKHIKTKID